MEEQFYLLWPALLTLIFARRAICCIFGLIVVMVTWRCFLALNGADPERTYNGFDTHGDAPLIGVYWRFLSGEIPIRQSN
jgi:peptidoglycan/LPS O-acetylase OafA/YrhL